MKLTTSWQMAKQSHLEENWELNLLSLLLQKVRILRKEEVEITLSLLKEETDWVIFQSFPSQKSVKLKLTNQIFLQNNG